MGRVLVLVLALAIIPAMAHASSINFSPVFYHPTSLNFSQAASSNATGAPLVVNAAPFCGSAYSCTAVNGLSFTFALSTALQATLHFTNLSGVNWHSLTLTEVGVAAADINCTSNIFSCSVLSDGANAARIVLTAFGALIGVPAGQSFELGFGCKSGGCVAWPNTDFEAAANLVPEPNTAMLALTGFGLILSIVILRRRHIFSA